MEASAQGAGAAGEPQATREMPALGAQAGDPPPAADPPPAVPAAAQPDPFAARPERYLGAAFAGGFLLAKIVKRFGR